MDTSAFFPVRMPFLFWEKEASWDGVWVLAGICCVLCG
jgi:hypothetical protein